MIWRKMFNRVKKDNKMDEGINRPMNTYTYCRTCQDETHHVIHAIEPDDVTAWVSCDSCLQLDTVSLSDCEDTLDDDVEDFVIDCEGCNDPDCDCAPAERVDTKRVLGICAGSTYNSCLHYRYPDRDWGTRLECVEHGIVRPDLGYPGQDVKATAVVPSKPRSVADMYPSNAGKYASYGGGYGSYGMLCEHWRDDVKIGRNGKITVSAWHESKQGTRVWDDPAGMSPDLGVYLATSWQPRILSVGIELPTRTQFPYSAVFYDWLDMHAPRSVPVMTILSTIKEALAAGKHVDIGCIGAHGRTGTLLALLIADLEGLPARDCIAQVRARHCKDAIETMAQENFIYRYCGEVPPRRATKSYTVTPASSSRGSHKYDSRQQRKAAKKARRMARKEWQKLIKDNTKAGEARGLTAIEYLKTLESDEYRWLQCENCGTVDKKYIPTHKRPTNDKDRITLHCLLCHNWTEWVRGGEFLEG